MKKCYLFLLLCIICLQVFGSVGCECVIVDGTSMLPGYKNGDLGVVVPIVPVRAGDVVSVSVSYDGLKGNLLKRVVAAGGDTVTVSDGHLFRNGELVKESYVFEEAEEDMESVVVEDGCFFVMGDNRNHSVDSRNSSVGCVPASCVNGRFFLFRFAWVIQVLQVLVSCMLAKFLLKCVERKFK